jgi:hypothetical protein
MIGYRHPDLSLTGAAALAAFFELESRNTMTLFEHRSRTGPA